MISSYNSLTDKERRDVASECLACLAYFAIVSLRCRPVKIKNALANSTRIAETLTVKSRYNWWHSKLANIQYAFNFNALNGATLHGIPTFRKKGKGRSGLPKDQEGVRLSKAQIQIHAFALQYFLADLDLCKALARTYLDRGSRLPDDVEEALFGFDSDGVDSSSNQDADLILEKASTGRNGFEGAKKLAEHYRRERDAGLALRAKAAFAATHHNKLFCEACGCEPLKVYGVEVIEAHHKTPLSSYADSRETKIEDLLMLCPSCHRAVHRIPDCSFDVLKARFGSR
jgi:HNH endonuclease